MRESKFLVRKNSNPTAWKLGWGKLQWLSGHSQTSNEDLKHSSPGEGDSETKQRAGVSREDDLCTGGQGRWTSSTDSQALSPVHDKERLSNLMKLGT